MKHIFIFTLCCLLLCGCGSPTPTVLPTPTEAPPADVPQTLPETMGDPIPTFLPTLYVEEGQSVDCDLNGDGTLETVEIEIVKLSEYMEYRTLRVTGSGVSISAGETMIQSRARICLTDLDFDGVYEILFSGDIASDDYITYACRWTNQSLVPIPFSGEVRDNVSSGPQYVDGSVETVENGVVTLSSHLFMLGTYLGYRPYELKADGSIAPADGSIWEFRGNDFWMETSMDLSAELPAGTKLRLTGADGVSQVWYVREDGQEGSLLLAKSVDKWGWCINGVHELDCFVMLPYAG